MRSFLLIALGVISACAARVEDLDTDEGTFKEAERLFERGFYEEARSQYFRIKTEFPRSSLHYEASLKIADSYFEEGSYQAAANSYQDFIQTYTGRTEVAYALYRMGLSHAKQMPNHPQRDTRSTERTLDTFTRLLLEFPDSEYSEKAEEWIDRAEDQLAKKEYQIARFYERQKEYEAAARRYTKVYSDFPQHELAEEAMARKVSCLRNANEDEEAERIKEEFQDKYPNSNFNSLIQS